MPLFEDYLPEYRPDGEEKPYGVKGSLFCLFGIVAVVLAFPFILLVVIVSYAVGSVWREIFKPSQVEPREGGDVLYFGYGWA